MWQIEVRGMRENKKQIVMVIFYRFFIANFFCNHFLGSKFRDDSIGLDGTGRLSKVFVSFYFISFTI